jgi:hypothetical protein
MIIRYEYQYRRLERQKGRSVFGPGCIYGISSLDLLISERHQILRRAQPTCHQQHLPQYLQRYNEFKAKGVDVIAVVSANDMWVLNGWL